MVVCGKGVASFHVGRPPAGRDVDRGKGCHPIPAGRLTAGRVSRRGNVTPASSGRVDGPAACKARRGPDGVRGGVDFCDPAKIRDIPGLPTGDIPSRGRAADGERNPKIVRSALLGVSLNTSRADSEYIKKPSQMLLKGLFKKLR